MVTGGTLSVSAGSLPNVNSATVTGAGQQSDSANGKHQFECWGHDRRSRGTRHHHFGLELGDAVDSRSWDFNGATLNFALVGTPTLSNVPLTVTSNNGLTLSPGTNPLNIVSAP